MRTPPILSDGRKVGTSSSGPSRRTGRPSAWLASAAMRSRQGAALIVMPSATTSTEPITASASSEPSPMLAHFRILRNTRSAATVRS